MLTPGQRRSISYLSTGALGCAAVRALMHGSLGSAHSFALAATGTILIPTLWKNSQWFGPVETRFDTLERHVWLTIDDGPDPEETPGILRVLEKHGVKATFFAIGERVRRWPDLAREIVRSGHGLQNHTYHHSSGTFWCASPGRASREISMCGDVILETTGVRPNLFRTPVGLANPFVHATVQRAGLRMVGWSATGWDGVSYHPGKVIARILGHLSPGAIILIHEGSLRGIPQGTRARTLDELLFQLKLKGYEAVLPDIVK